MAQKLLTLDEAAARLGISSDELLHFIDQRKIFAIKDGGSWKFKPEEVDRFKSDIGFIPLSYDPRFISILAQDLLLAGALLGALGSYIGVRRYVRI